MTGTGGRGEKRAHIIISSSSSESEEGSETSESEYEFHGDGVDTSRESGSEDDGSEWSESDDERDESSESEDVKEESSDHHFNRVMRLLRGRGDLQELKLAECKVYLRKHGLRLSGTKEECIERILEHWRIKDGKGETFYPRSSFNINCTGDVCKGDVVLFTQKVYKNFDKMTRSGDVLGRRTVAGRVVKESYGAAKQQHTFTRWKNENERLGVLAEKHRRGAAARLVRETRKMRSVKRKQSFTDTGGLKKQKCDHIRPSHVRQSMKGRKPEKENHIHKRGSNKSSTYHHGKLPQTGKQKMNQGRNIKATSSHQRPPNYASANQFRERSFHPFTFQSADMYRQSTFVPPRNYHQFQSETYDQRIPHPYSYDYDRASASHRFQSETYGQRISHPYSYDRASASTMNMPHGSSSSSAMAKQKQRNYGHRNSSLP